MSEPHLSAADRGLTLADGVFETMRAHAGVVFRLDRTSRASRMRSPRSNSRRRQTCASRVLAAVRGADAASRPPDRHPRRRWRRRGGPALGRDRPTVIVSVSDPPVFPAATYDAGFTAHVASGRRNEHAMTAGLKTLAYTDVGPGADRSPPRRRRRGDLSRYRGTLFGGDRQQRLHLGSRDPGHAAARVRRAAGDHPRVGARARRDLGVPTTSVRSTWTSSRPRTKRS